MGTPTISNGAKAPRRRDASSPRGATSEASAGNGSDRVIRRSDGGEVRFGQDGILRFLQPRRQHVTIDVDIVEESVRAYHEILKDQRVPVLVEMHNVSSFLRDARKQAADTDIASATAMVVGSRLSRLIVRIFVAVDRPAVPTRVFESTDDALAWLKTFQEP
ncbi:MAG: STAS/SEC14 domain-containing protein [Myxococcales bacterium]|nr:STAS/SEC14 domain-containing protein [Myxococcales bacterium]